MSLENQKKTAVSEKAVVLLNNKVVRSKHGQLTHNSAVIKLGNERTVVTRYEGYTNDSYQEQKQASFSVLDELEDYEINPSAPQVLTKQVVRDQVAEFINTTKHHDRVIPIWREPLKIRTIGLVSDTNHAQTYSSALNQLSLLSDLEISHVNSIDEKANVMVMFIRGKEQLCIDKSYRDALKSIGMEPKTIYERIEQNSFYDKQATEYRFLRYSAEGASFFLYIVDVEWIDRLAKPKEERAEVFNAQLQNAAFKVFSLQEGVADSVKYSHMNHKYFWKRMKDYSPIDREFIRKLYGSKMQNPRSKQQAAKCLTYYIWKEMARRPNEEVPMERLMF